MPDDEELHSSETNQDFISNLPTDLIEDILKRLPLSAAAKMSVLSKRWREYWFSHPYLTFDREFWTEQIYPGGNGNNNYKFDYLGKLSTIISRILSHHNGPVHTFHLVNLRSYRDVQVTSRYDYTSSWITHLSRIGVKNIIIESHWQLCPYIPSHIYECKDLVKLRLRNCTMADPPSDFKGFAYLQTLELVNMKIDLRRLLHNCPLLTDLNLDMLNSMNNVVFDFPNLKHLTIKGLFNSIAFHNVENLEDLTIIGVFESIVFHNMQCSHLSSIAITLKYATPATMTMSKETYGVFHRLVCTCKLQRLHLGGDFSQVLLEGCTTKQLTMAFEHLQQLCLTNIELQNHDDYCFTISMIQRCPFIKDLIISMSWRMGEINAGQYNLEYDENYRSKHLLRVHINGVIGSDTELELIEYILASSVALENLCIGILDIDIPSEFILLHELRRIPRASTKAEIQLKRMFGDRQ